MSLQTTYIFLVLSVQQQICECPHLLSKILWSSLNQKEKKKCELIEIWKVPATEKIIYIRKANTVSVVGLKGNQNEWIYVGSFISCHQHKCN